MSARVDKRRSADPPGEDVRVSCVLRVTFGLTVDERIAIEVDEAETTEKPGVSEASTAYLWFC